MTGPRKAARAPRKAAAKAAPRTSRTLELAPLPPGPAFGARGHRLWSAYHDQVEGQCGLVLLEEACRTADRLDKLDALLRGDADVWCRLVHNIRNQDYELRIDSALTEARQQANTLRQLVASLPLKGAEDDGDDDDWIAGLSS